MQLVLKEISITGFKGYKDTVKYQLSNRTVIKGGNGLGKSSIRDAIVWALTGCDSTGNEKATTKLVNDEKPKVMEVVMDFMLDGEPQTIIRSKRGSSNECYWNDKKVTTSDIARDIFKNKDLFLSILNPYYFPDLAPKDAKQLLSDVLKPVSREDIFSELGDYLKKLLLDNEFRIPETFMKDKKRELKEHQDNVIYLEGCIDGISYMDVEEKQEFTKEKELSEFKKLLDSIKTNNFDEDLKEFDNLEKQLKKERDNVNILNPIDRIQKSYRKDSLLMEYKKLDSEINNFKRKYIKCDNCGHDVDLSAEIIKQMEMRKQDILAEGQALKNELAEIDKKNEDILAKNKLITDKVNELFDKGMEEVEKGRYDVLKRKEQADEKNKNKIVDVKSKIKDLEEKKRDIEIHNSKVDQAINYNRELDSKAERDKERISNSKNKIEQLKLAIDSCKQYNSIKLKKQSYQINKYLDKVTIQFEKLSKDGELKDDFKVLYEGKEFGKLSNSEKIKSGLEISNLLMNIQKMFIPVFVDDAESINVIPELNTQMLIAKVTSDKEIKLEGEK